ncbi:hypothetical protein DBR00_04955 [Pseudomonas sp. HMWF032]|uniref:DUF3261 domain-containing protein n=1 Tax=unclassified Pseudomonas TaxID=196821 RepID=UPI000D3D8565|nr:MULTISPECIES: DUF3261 domain-containing protein [unclassified Pseudomonas]PTS85149.1 hypothetical protein DBR00_04955 [Pseudomonas sp. HMWF032]PTT84908.1 hypothetical protein DBR41_05810 [Pseudomonas sp. HMWF010]WAC42791.1 DUF3261 domain-containing protein [Pseudomonas sp. SL4(2022)]
MRHAWLIGLCLLLAACAAQTPLLAPSPALVVALPLALQVQRQQVATQQTWWLVLQNEPEGLRASLFDPLGVPLARQVLRAGQWQNDGLLPPNAEARELFSALLFALTPDAQLPRQYPVDHWRLDADGTRWLNPQWRIRYRAPLDFTLNRSPDLIYQVSPLPDDKAP